MAHVELTRAAVEDIDRIIKTHSLPDDTRTRIRQSLEPLAQFPLLGPELAGQWSGYRFVLGPWRWLLLLYIYEQETDRAVIVTAQDARAARSATALR